MKVEKPEWLLRYKHSVQKTVVEEHFWINKDNISLMYKTIYSSFGVGLPFLQSEGELSFIEDGRMQLNFANPRSFNVVMLWTGPEAEVVLLVNNETINLYDIYPPGTLLEISVKSRYLLYWEMFCSKKIL